MSVDDSPPPYAAVVAAPGSFESPHAAAPFSHSDRLAADIRALVSEGNALCARFKDIHDVVSAGVNFEYQVPALVLSERFETLIWESRNMASVALVAVKDFNDIILEFLSEPNATIQDRIKELTGASKLLKRERDSAAGHMSSFSALVKELEDFNQTIHSESSVLTRRRRRQSHSDGRGIRGGRSLRKSRPPYIVPRPEPMSGFSTLTASLGTISRTCMDYALHIERVAERTVFPFCAGVSPGTWAADHPEPALSAAPDANANPAARARICPPRSATGQAEPRALPVLVDALVRDTRVFAGHAEVFNAVLVELAREQDVFVLYLKDGQSIANQGYRSEINRLRRHLPRVCGALDAYSKARLS